MNKMLANEFPSMEFSLELFGSSKSGLFMKDADLDFCLDIKTNLSEMQTIREISNIMRRNRMLF